MTTRIFSGMRPSGKLHLGNYLGAIKNWIALQDAPDTATCIFAAVDLHAITTPYDPATFQKNINDVLLDYLAAGVDPKRSLLIRQSRVPQHAELMWLLSTITPVGWLERLPNYREKLTQVAEMTPSFGFSGSVPPGKDVMQHAREQASTILDKKSYQNNLSLLAYPVLMAADILLYKADLVPVGDDQLPHIELTNEVGSKFNHLFGETFPNVRPFVAPGARIMSLQDPTKKMSKTGDDGIALTDSPDEIRGKIKRATTDSGREIMFNETDKPGISNLLTIFSTLSGAAIDKLERDYAGKSYGDFKADLAEVVVGFLEPFQRRRAEFAADPATLAHILTESEEKARIVAAEHLAEIHQKMGLR
ncbi:MAG: tryptophan--tRNA ligase [Candidatus Yanofskybacteria bacterium]|nr:tryptophan--tRNA ligase [Candidatus Yanofskybacteria bacterium]